MLNKKRLALFLLGVVTTSSCAGVKFGDALSTPQTHSPSEKITVPAVPSQTQNPKEPKGKEPKGSEPVASSQAQNPKKPECTEKECVEKDRILTKSAKTMLTELGFFKENLGQAIVDFQLNGMALGPNEITSKLDERTYLALLEKFRQKYQAKLATVKQEYQAELNKLKAELKKRKQKIVAKPKRTQPKPSSKPKSSPKPKPSIPKSTLQLGTEVYAIAETKCEKHGEWALLYKGSVTGLIGKKVVVAIQKRYAFKHHPTKKGISKKDWFCAPKRKYCYSEVKFSAWQGKHRPNDTVTFPTADVFPVNEDIVPGTDKILQRTCRK